jgi:hypothetical protein
VVGLGRTRGKKGVKLVEIRNAYSGFAFSDDVEDSVRKRIEETLQALEIIFPGLLLALEWAETVIMYDPRNKHGIFTSREGELIARGTYYFSKNTIYLGKSGLKSSIPHEVAHCLDVISGPPHLIDPVVIEVRKHLGVKNLRSDPISFGLYHMYLAGTFEPAADREIDEDNFSEWAEENQYRSFLLKAILQCRLAQNNWPEAADGVLNKLINASKFTVEDGLPEMSEFVMERIAHLFEQYFYWKQSQNGGKPIGLGSLKRFDDPVMWEMSWIEDNQEAIEQFFRAMLGQIGQQHADDVLQKKIRGYWVSPVESILGDNLEFWD